MTSLPQHGLLQQLTGENIDAAMTQIHDALCRVKYYPDGFASGTPDAFHVMAVPPYEPLDPLRFLLYSASDVTNTASSDRITDLVSEAWAAHAVDCGGSQDILDAACVSLQAYNVPGTFSFVLSPSNLVPTSSGYAVVFSAQTYMNLTVVAVNDSSVGATWQALQPPIRDSVSYVWNAWLQLDGEMGLTGERQLQTLVSGVAMCGGLPCERFALAITDSLQLQLSVYCAGVALYTGVSDVAMHNSTEWEKVSVVWGADLRGAMTVYLNGSQVLSTAQDGSDGSSVDLTCSAVTAHRDDIGVTSLIVGAEAVGDAVMTALPPDRVLQDCTATSTPSRHLHMCNHYFGLMDDVAVFAVASRSLTAGSMSRVLTGVNSVDVYSPDARDALPPDVSVLCALGFDNPLALLWQPPLVTTKSPQHFASFRSSVPVSVVVVVVVVAVAWCCLLSWLGVVSSSGLVLCICVKLRQSCRDRVSMSACVRAAATSDAGGAVEVPWAVRRRVTLHIVTAAAAAIRTCRGGAASGAVAVTGSVHGAALWRVPRRGGHRRHVSAAGRGP